jgi:hypothetical protein
MFEKQCPCCDKKMVYKNKRSYNKSVTNNTCCLSCSRTGENNHFYGKKHKPETIDKIKKTSENSEKRKKYYDKIRSNEYRDFLSKKFMGENNPNYGKGYVKSWVNKYGEDVANEMVKQFRELQSKHSSGENNPMFGKPAPKKSGSGISGWYKDIYFRSLLELSFIVNYLERFNMDWECGELNKFVIKYEYDGKVRNYFPDFVINGKYIVECKPKSLWNTKLNQTKFKFAKEYCEKNNMIYKVINPIRIESTKLNHLIDLGLVKLTKNSKYEN